MATVTSGKGSQQDAYEDIFSSRDVDLDELDSHLFASDTWGKLGEQHILPDIAPVVQQFNEGGHGLSFSPSRQQQEPIVNEYQSPQNNTKTLTTPPHYELFLHKLISIPRTCSPSLR